MFYLLGKKSHIVTYFIFGSNVWNNYAKIHQIHKIWQKKHRRDWERLSGLWTKATVDPVERLMELMLNIPLATQIGHFGDALPRQFLATPHGKE